MPQLYILLASCGEEYEIFDSMCNTISISHCLSDGQSRAELLVDSMCLTTSSCARRSDYAVAYRGFTLAHGCAAGNASTTTG
jgi:hypothetical protein